MVIDFTDNKTSQKPYSHGINACMYTFDTTLLAVSKLTNSLMRMQTFQDVPLVEFRYLVFTRMPGG